MLCLLNQKFKDDLYQVLSQHYQHTFSDRSSNSPDILRRRSCSTSIYLPPVTLLSGHGRSRGLLQPQTLSCGLTYRDLNNDTLLSQRHISLSRGASIEASPLL